MQALTSLSNHSYIRPAAHSTTRFSAAALLPRPRFSRDNVRFSGVEEIKLLDYKALNPDLSAEKIKVYEKAEREWHQLLEGINPSTDYEKLLARVKAQPDVELHERLWVLTGKPGVKALTNKNTPESKTTILLWDKNGYVNEAERTEILAHEMLHVLHVRYGLMKSHQERVPDKSEPNLRAFEANLMREDNLSEYASYYLTAEKLGPKTKPALREILAGFLKLKDVGKDYRRKLRNFKLANTYKPYL